MVERLELISTASAAASLPHQLGLSEVLSTVEFKDKPSFFVREGTSRETWKVSHGKLSVELLLEIIAGTRNSWSNALAYALHFLFFL